MKKSTLILYGICFLFFVLYATLSIVRHNHYLSAYDLSVVDQIMWKYSKFRLPVTTVHAYSHTLIFTDHIELIYLLLSPLYWVWNDVRALLAAQAFFISFSAIPVFLLARKKNLNLFISYALVINYLLFYGIQNAIWNDVHSIVFGASFLPWLIYFLEIHSSGWTYIAFFLAILCKEDIALLTLFIAFTYFILKKDKISVLLMIFSVIYLFAIFFVYYPHFTHDGYRFQNKGGLLSNIQLSNYVNSPEKRETFFYSLAWFGFLPLLAPLYLLTAIADITHYFIIGQTVVTAQGIYLHYRVTLAVLLVWPTIIVLSRFKKLNSIPVAIYLLFCAFSFQYILHLPLSYLTKSWFWHTSDGVKNINSVLRFLPADAPVVSEVNIIPHIAHRDEMYTLWTATKNSKPWFHWDGKPEYLIADTSPEWDIRQLFQNNQAFNQALNSMEKEGVIKKYKQIGTAIIYKVLKKS